MTKPGEAPGFAEQPRRRYGGATGDGQTTKPPRFERMKLGDGGRVVIPAPMREEMGIKPGDELIADVEDGVLHVLVLRAESLRRIQAEVSSYKKPGESVVDELLAETRGAMWAAGMSRFCDSIRP